MRNALAQKVVPAAERQNNFDLVDHGICAEHICEEAGRCLQCDLRVQLHTPRNLDGIFRQ